MMSARVIGPETGSAFERFIPRLVTGEEAHRRRLVCRRRKAYEMRLGSTVLRLRPEMELRLSDGHVLDLLVGGVPARLVLDRALRHRLLTLARDDLPMLSLGPEVEGLVFERLFEDVLPAVERRFGAVALGVRHVGNAFAGRRDFSLEIPGERSWALSLLAPHSLLKRFDLVWQRQPVVRRPVDHVPLDLGARIMRTRLDGRQIGDLDTGDVVFGDAAPPERGFLLGVVEPALAVPLRVDGKRLVAASRPVALRNLPLPWQSMIEDLMTDETDQDQAWGDVPVDLVFELQRLRLPLGELQSMEAGHVLELDRALNEAVDIRVKGRRIGRGELVMIHDRLGVRIVSLSGERHDPES